LGKNGGGQKLSKGVTKPKQKCRSENTGGEGTLPKTSRSNREKGIVLFALLPRANRGAGPGNPGAKKNATSQGENGTAVQVFKQRKRTAGAPPSVKDPPDLEGDGWPINVQKVI